MPEAPIIIKTAKGDNVGIVANGTGLQEGTVLINGTILIQNIPAGHKVALSDISEGGEIIRYDQIIGYANRVIRQGEHVHESSMFLPEPPGLDSIPVTSVPRPDPEPLNGYSFYGYRNADGSAGTSLSGF